MRTIITYIFLGILLLAANILQAQVEIDQKVVSSGGLESNTSTLQISSTIGETIVTTEQSSTSALNLSQGFHQVVEGDSIRVFFTLSNAACIGRSNGRVFIDSIKGCEAPYTVFWSAGGNPNDQNEARNLAIGDYTVQIISNDGCQNSFPFTIGYESEEPCFIDFFTGITPDGDGRNDSWQILNIEAFKKNKVTIVNRLGNIVFQEENYDNVNVVWTGNNLSGNELPSDTYFYVFEADGNFERGWIELTR